MHDGIFFQIYTFKVDLWSIHNPGNQKMKKKVRGCRSDCKTVKSSRQYKMQPLYKTFFFFMFKFYFIYLFVFRYNILLFKMWIKK